MIEQKIYEKAKKIFINEKISITKIAERLDIDRKQLSKMLKEDGIFHGKGYTENQVKEVMDRYNNGETFISICNDLKIGRYGMVNYLKQKGYIEEKEDTSYETHKDMINDYLNNNYTSKELWQKYNISEPRFLHVLKMNNVSKQPHRTYRFNEKYFDEIDTEEKAYWLGFLYADGYNGGNTVELALKESDYNHIVKFSKCIGYGGGIRYIEKTKAYRLSLCSNYLCEALANKGCHKNKSLTLKFPSCDIVPKKLIRHFLRGYIDGDGCIGLYGKKNQTKQFRLEILGTEEFLNETYKILIAECHVKKNKYTMNGKAYTICLSGNKNGVRLTNFIYKNANIYLDRKYKKYKEFNMLIAHLSQRFAEVIE